MNDANQVYRSLDAKTDSRLAFVNPNAAYGGIDGIPFTPPYEDMCISVNLEIEVVNRTKTDNVGYNGAEFNGNKYVMSWTSNYEVDASGNFTGKTLKTEPIYFMQGRDAQEYLDGLSKKKFLTTYYTDISLEDIRNRNIIEGLGITNVEIAYDNMYMPTITIKFVDVRGSSLFGREEEVHDGNNITSETIFGCFFTLPYPKFRLHVKGFFGDAVTYQLACTGFKGNFNSQTGNFEITTTFIGYQYSLLTDIPFVLLIAAPYCEYIGEKYWERHVKKPEWQLSGGARMKKLYEMYTNLKKELKDGISEGKTATSIDMSSADIAVKQLNGIWEEIKTAIKGRCTYMGYTEDGKPYKDEKTNENHYICLMKDKAKIYDQTIGHKLANMKEEIDKYNAKFTDKQLSFKISETFSKSNETETTQYIDYKKDKGNSITCTQLNVTYNCSALKDFIKNKLTEEKGKYTFFEDKIYGFEFSDGGYEHSAKNVVEGITTQKKEEEAKAKEKNKDYVPEEISKALEFKPSIGNFFKVIIAHLETFTAMMYGCSTTILKQMKNGGRSPQKLGVNFDNTDVLPSQKFIPPFPAVFKREINKDETIEESSDDKGIMTKALGWVGDFSANFEEEKLIVAIFNAAQRIVESKEKLSTKKNIDVSKLFPSMPFDLYTENTMTSIGGFTTDMLAALLGIRMTQIFGILNDGQLTDDNIAEAHGKMDALNLFQAVAKKGEIRDALFTEKKSDGDKKDEKTSKYTSKLDIVYDMMRCLKNKEAEEYAILDKNNNVVKYEFEYHSYGKPGASESGTQYIYDDNRRYMQPVVIDGNKIDSTEKDTTYTYIWGGTNGDEFGIVPVKMQEPSGIFGTLVFNRSDSGNEKSSTHNINLHTVGVDEYFNEYLTSNTTELVTNDNLIHNVPSKKFLDGNSDPKIYHSYINESVFNIITDKDVVKAIEDRCETLKKDDIKIDGYDGKISNFKTIIDRYYDFDVNKYLTEQSQYLAKAKKDTLSAEEIQKDKINTGERQYEITAGETRSSINKKLEFMDMKKAFSTKDFNEYFVPYCLCKCYNQSGTGGQTVSLEITSAFLNLYELVDDKNDEVSILDIDFIHKLKLWWLIQTVPLKWELTKNIFKSNGKHGCIKKVPLAMVLLLGGAIYFARYINKTTTKVNNKIPTTNLKKIFKLLEFNFPNDLIDNTSGYKSKAIDGNWKNNIDLVGPLPFVAVYGLCNKNSNGDMVLKTFLREDGGSYKMSLLHYNGQNAGIKDIVGQKGSDWLSFKEIFGGADDINWMPDSVIANKLYTIFVEWCENTGKDILNGMMSAPSVSWAGYRTIRNEMADIYNGKNLDRTLNATGPQHVFNVWGGNGSSANNGYRLPYTTHKLKERSSNYCNWFQSVWGETPMKGWSYKWEEDLHKEKWDGDVTKAKKKCLPLYSGRSSSSDNKCNWMENDEHWLAVDDGKEFVAYWQSDVSFREALIELYTGTCLVCINSPQFNNSNNTMIEDI